MTELCAAKLNSGILFNKTIKKVRLNFCINKLEILKVLMPCLTKSMNIEEINLAANDLDDEYAYMLNKILSSHQEKKDEIIWKYGLRNERPPLTSMSSLKRFNLSHNRLTVKTVRIINRSVKSDNYCRALSLRANNLDTESVEELYDALKDNGSMFNLDLRQNPGLSQKLHRLLALKMLSNYTRSGQLAQQESPEMWKEEQRFFNPKLLIVEIPTRMIKTYARKLENIRNNCFVDQPQNRSQSTQNLRSRSAKSLR